MDIVVGLLASYSLCFGMMHNKMPWLTGRFRLAGLECAYCTGFRAGLVTGGLMFIAGSLPTSGLFGTLAYLLLWAMASAATCYILDVTAQRLETE